MAHFRATIEGNGTASRLGSKASSIAAEVQSWQGKVTARLYHHTATGKDMAVVMLEPHAGEGVSRVLYMGPVDGSPDPIPADLAALTDEALLASLYAGRSFLGEVGSC